MTVKGSYSALELHTAAFQKLIFLPGHEPRTVRMYVVRCITESRFVSNLKQTKAHHKATNPNNNTSQTSNELFRSAL